MRGRGPARSPLLAPDRGGKNMQRYPLEPARARTGHCHNPRCGSIPVRARVGEVHEVQAVHHPARVYDEEEVGDVGAISPVG